MRPRRVVIAGGGITGLTAAYRLLRAGSDAAGAPIEVTLLEARPRLGGTIVTERRDGFVLDGGPDSFVAAGGSSSVTALCKELGIGDSLIATPERNRKVYVRRGGVLHALPDGLALEIEPHARALARSGLFTWPGKARMALELLLPRRRANSDESVGRFIERRLGREALARLAEPLLGGVYAGDVETLSLRATFPRLLEMEEKHGGLLRGALARRWALGARGTPPSTFLSLLGGMGELVEALARAVEAAGGEIRIGAALESVTAGGGAGRLRIEIAGDAEATPADDVILCTPAFASADALDALDRELANRLRQIPYVSTATVILGFPRIDVPHPLDASGLILPRGEGLASLTATFISSKWVGRAPDDIALLRVLLGGHRDPGVLARSDDELVALVRREMEELLGVRARSVLARVFRHERAHAQPSIGHPARLARVRALAARHPGLQLAGAGFEGVGIPGCVRQAEEAAAHVVGERSSIGPRVVS